MLLAGLSLNFYHLPWVLLPSADTMEPTTNWNADVLRPILNGC